MFLDGHEVLVDLIKELVTEVENKAEDKSAFDAFTREGVKPFGSNKMTDLVKASELSSLIIEEIIKRVDGCDSSFASLVFLQTEEGLKDLCNRINSKESMDSGVGVFCRSDDYISDIEEHDITPDEQIAIVKYLDSYKKKIDDEFEEFKKNSYAQYITYKAMKTKEAFGNSKGSFRKL